MSQPNRFPGICGACQKTVPGGNGVIRRWNGAARAHKPAYAKPSATGTWSALLCDTCDTERTNQHTWRLS